MQIAILTEAKAERVDASIASDSFESLVHRQSRFVFRIAYSILRNTQDADDVVQETFLKIYRARAWDRMQDERGFLARAAWRIAVDHRTNIRIEPPPLNLESSAENPEQAAISADWNSIVHRLIDALPEELRRPLALSTVEELRTHEIASIMDIPEGTVRSRLNRAREILKQKLGQFIAGPYGK